MSEELINIACPHCVRTNRLPNNKLQQNPKCGNCHQPLFINKPIDLTDFNFSKVISNTHIPIVVDFWADWCGPCKMMAPIFKQIAAELEPGIRFAKVNTEVAQNIAVQYGIRSIPTLIVFKNGKEITRQAGAVDASNLKQFLQSHV